MPEPAPDSLPLVGRKLGRFRVTAKLGHGGIASVWKAQDELLGRTVALKVLDESLGNSKTRRRFVHEAQAASLLDHPGIVTVYDAGESEGRAYMALTFVDGDTVTDLASRRLMPIEEAIRITTAAADALEHAHGRGVVHRDVTGRNIMVARDGRVIVLDFGLALAVGMTRLTSSETALGTMAYMSPEAISGHSLDVRTDIYGLGTVLFEALTGAFPFPGDRPEVVAFAKLNHPPRRPSDLRPDVPAEVDRIVMRAIARVPDERYARIGLMIEDLRGAADALRAGGGVAPSGATATPAPTEPATTTRATVPGVAGSRPVALDPYTSPDPLYLAILPFELHEPAADSDGQPRALAQRLPEMLSAMLGSDSRLRVVSVPASLPAETMAADPKRFASLVGANAVLKGTIHRDGTRLRVTFWVRDLWRNVQLAGDVVDGSVLRAFDLEDAIAASVRKALGLRGPATVSETARTEQPVDPAARDRYVLAVHHLEQHDDDASLDAAVQLLERLEASDPGRSEYPATLARVCLRKQKLTHSRIWESKAAAACDRARQLDPDSFETRLALAEMTLATGRPNDALVELRSLGDRRPESAEPWLAAAQALFALGDYDGAEHACSQAIQRRGDDWRGHNRLGYVRFQRGNYPEALAAWRRVIELVPDSLRGRMNVAVALLRLNRFDEALVESQYVVSRQPNAEAYWNVGTILYFLGRDDEAIDALERAVAMSPENPVSWGNLGNVCRQVPGREPRARDALRKAVALAQEELARNPAAAEMRARLSGWLTGLDQNEAAERQIEHALGDAPQDVHVLETAAHVYLLLGKRDLALRWLKDAVTRGYGVDELKRSREFAVLREDPEFRSLIDEANRK